MRFDRRDRATYLDREAEPVVGRSLLGPWATSSRRQRQETVRERVAELDPSAPGRALAPTQPAANDWPLRNECADIVIIIIICYICLKKR